MLTQRGEQGISPLLLTPPQAPRWMAVPAFPITTLTAVKTVTSGQPGDFKGHWMAPTCDISKAVLHIASNWVPYPFWKPRLLFPF